MNAIITTHLLLPYFTYILFHLLLMGVMNHMMMAYNKSCILFKGEETHIKRSLMSIYGRLIWTIERERERERITYLKVQFTFQELNDILKFAFPRSFVQTCHFKV